MNLPPDDDFVIAPLSAAMIPTAFALVRLAFPGTEMQAWRRFARRAIGAGRSPLSRPEGILTIRRRSRPYLCGLVWYGTTADLKAGRVLEARHLIAVDIVDPAPLVAALTQALAAIAERGHCKLVRLLLEDHKGLAERVTDRGFVAEGRMLSRGVPPGALSAPA